MWDMRRPPPGRNSQSIKDWTDILPSASLATMLGRCLSRSLLYLADNNFPLAFCCLCSCSEVPLPRMPFRYCSPSCQPADCADELTYERHCSPQEETNRGCVRESTAPTPRASSNGPIQLSRPLGTTD